MLERKSKHNLLFNNLSFQKTCRLWENVGKYRGADKSLSRPGRKQHRKHVRDARDFNNIETRAVTKFFFSPLQGKVPKEIHASLTETLACFLPGRTKDLSAPVYCRTGQATDDDMAHEHCIPLPKATQTNHDI